MSRPNSHPISRRRWLALLAILVVGFALAIVAAVVGWVGYLIPLGSATRCRAGGAVAASAASQETPRGPRYLGLVAIGSGANGAIDEEVQRPHKAKFAESPECELRLNGVLRSS